MLSATVPTKFVDLFHMQLCSIQVCLVMLGALSPSLVRGYTINFWLLFFMIISHSIQNLCPKTNVSANSRQSG
jgi:general stress protein CsbA